MGFDFGDGFIFLDGAMGTMLQNSGLKLGEKPELLSITHGETITAIHRQYVEAGANIIYANTFGANSLKLADCEYSLDEVIGASVGVARAACVGTSARVALDVGPLGEMMKPTGTLSFDEAYVAFREVALAGERAGADLVVMETMTDLYEVKAGVLAVKENTSLPLFVSLSFEENGRTFTGCSIESMAVVLEGLGIDAIGINCSLGPREIFPLAKRLSRHTTLPIFIKPNAGLPNLNSDCYDISPQGFAVDMVRYAELGVSIVGGCCGTTPEYIRALVEAFEGKLVVRREVQLKSCVCTPTRYVVIEDVRVIGERLNPTGKRVFRQALIDKNMNYILQQALSQIEAGADILDVNVGIPDIDEALMMKEVVVHLQAITDTPLQIDSSDRDAVETALRVYNGKAIVNSVNGELEVLDSLLPIVKKYGAAVVGLTLDKNGIPPLAEDRFDIAKRIMEKALEYGIGKQDIIIDCLTLTASAQQREAQETLKAVRMVKERLGLKTALGVSNISFGLPNRELLNHSFLLLAMGEGLDLPIINPNVESMMDAVRSFRLLMNIDENATLFIDAYKNHSSVKRGVAVTTGVITGETTAEAIGKTAVEIKKEVGALDIRGIIKKGLSGQAVEATQKLLQTVAPLDIVNNYLIPALDEVGDEFERGTLFLPQLLQAAQAAGVAFDEIKKLLARDGSKTISKGTIILATVKGDIHDIGKNIVKVILENYGYTIIDLGKDVAVERVVEELKRIHAPILGLSALMTTTLKSMQETITAVRDEKLDCKIIVGGAVLTEEYAMKMGADHYAKDAKKTVDIVKMILLN